MSFVDDLAPAFPSESRTAMLLHAVRSASLRGFAELTLSLGGDPEDILHRAGVPVEALGSDEVMITDVGAARAMELASRDLGVNDFGLRLSDFQDLSGLGPLALVIRNSATMGEALREAQRFMSFHHRESTLVVESDPYGSRGVQGLRYVSQLDQHAYRQASDNALLNLHRVIRLLANGDYGLRSVELAYRPTAPTARYESAFDGVRVNAGKPLTMLRLPSSARRRPIEDAQLTLRQIALFYLEQRAISEGSSVRSQVVAAVEAMLGSRRVAAADVSEGLGMSCRTMQRRLSEENTCFAAVLSDVKEQRALQLLTDPRVRIVDVAAALDFANHSTFDRAADRWWGMCPTAKRRELLTVDN